MLKPISEPRRLIEQEGHPHAVKRGWRWKLHFENLMWIASLLEWFLKTFRLWKLGQRNMLDVRVEQVELAAKNLPGAFDGFRILWISDLHIDPLDGLLEKVLTLVDESDFDMCVLGGDYSFWHVNNETAIGRMKTLARALVKRSDVYGILGNHDRYAMAEVLHGEGVRMLINENVRIERDGQYLMLIGVDDHHYYNADNFDEAMSSGELKSCKLLLCHSPEQYQRAAQLGIDIYLCGHTHGGQVCLPNGFAPVTCASVPRRKIKGRWQYRTMIGYTSRGAGASGVPVRFNCPPEVAVITLRKTQ